MLVYGLIYVFYLFPLPLFFSCTFPFLSSIGIKKTTYSISFSQIYLKILVSIFNAANSYFYFCPKHYKELKIQQLYGASPILYGVILQHFSSICLLNLSQNSLKNIFNSQYSFDFPLVLTIIARHSFLYLLLPPRLISSNLTTHLGSYLIRHFKEITPTHYLSENVIFVYQGIVALQYCFSFKETINKTKDNPQNGRKYLGMKQLARD